MERRDLLKGIMLGMSGAATLSANASHTSSTENLSSTSDGGIKLIEGYQHRLTSSSIGEWNLWGNLKEVIVGSAEGAILGEIEPLHQDLASPELIDLMKSGNGQYLKDAAPKFYDGIQSESEALVKIYESYGVKVHRPRVIRSDEVAYSFGHGANNIFACDPFWCVGRNVVESSWRKLGGRPQKWSIRELYQAKVDADPQVLLQSCPWPSPGAIGDYFFEVGDMLLVGNGNVILSYNDVGTSSNLRGCEWAKRALEADGFKVTIIKLPKTKILHLYAVLCIIGPGTAIAYEGAFPNKKLPTPIKDWNVVWCDFEEAKQTAACAVNINRRTVLLPSKAPKTINAVQNLGFDVVDLDFTYHALGEGGIRCATGVIYREID